MLHTVAIIADRHLEEGTIFILLLTPHQTQIHTQILDTATIHQLVTVMAAHSHDHSWWVVIIFNQTKLKSSTKLPEEGETEKGVLTKNIATVTY